MLRHMEDFAQLNAQRLAKALRFEEPDRVPVALNPVGPSVCSLTGTDLSEYYDKPQVQLAAQLKLRERFYNLTACWPDTSIAAEPSAFGAKVTWTADGTPWIEPLIKGPADVARLKVPNPETDGLMAHYLRTFAYMKEKVGDRVPVTAGSFHSPFGVAALLRGISQFCLDLYEQPEMARELLAICTEAVLAFLKAQEKINGAPFQQITISDDISAFVNPRQFRDIIAPLYRQIFAHFPDAILHLHNDADATHILVPVADTGIDSWHFADMVDLARAKREIGDRVCLIGNLSPLDVLRNATPEQVKAESRRQIEIAAPGGGFVLAAGGFLAEGTPPENLDALIAAAMETVPLVPEITY